MKRKYLIIIFSLLLLLTGCKNKDKETKEKKVDEIKWEVVDGEKIENNPYQEYEAEGYIDNYFITTYSKKVYKYLIPKDTKPSSISYASTVLTSSNMLITIESMTIDDIDSYLKKIVKDYKQSSEDVYVENKKINKDMFISHATEMEFNEGGTFYKDELNIYVRDDEEDWNIIQYTLIGSKFNDNLINKLVKGVQKEKDDSHFKNCNLNGSNYICTFDNIDGKKIEVKINKAEFDEVGYYENDNYNLNFSGENGFIRVGIIYYDDRSYMDGLESLLFNFNRVDDVNSNGKVFKKFVNVEDEDDEEYRTYSVYYVYEIDRNTALCLHIDSSTEDDSIVSSIISVDVK